jgi:hypothetical protein
MPPVHVTAEQCERFFRRAGEFDDLVRSTFRDHDVLQLTYEEMETCMRSVMIGVQAFLEVSPHARTTETLVKQETRPLVETIANYAELLDHFSGTPHEAFLRQ